MKCNTCGSSGDHNTSAYLCPKTDKESFKKKHGIPFHRRGKGKEKTRATQDTVSGDEGDYAVEDVPRELTRVTRGAEVVRMTRNSPMVSCHIGNHPSTDSWYAVDFVNDCLADTGSTRGLISQQLADRHEVVIVDKDVRYDLTGGLTSGSNRL